MQNGRKPTGWGGSKGLWVIWPKIVGMAEFSIHMGICWKNRHKAKRGIIRQACIAHRYVISWRSSMFWPFHQLNALVECDIFFMFSQKKPWACHLRAHTVISRDLEEKQKKNNNTIFIFVGCTFLEINLLKGRTFGDRVYWSDFS